MRHACPGATGVDPVLAVHLEGHDVVVLLVAEIRVADV